MDVGRQVSVEGFSEVPAQVKGRVEDTNVPAPGVPDEVREDLQSQVYGGGRQTQEGMCHPAGRADCGKTQSQAAGELQPLL